MPKYPVYIDFLAPEAQAVIGRTHDNTRPAVAMLEAEGFRYEGYVDIFDAGPTVQTYTSEIRAVRESALKIVRVLDPLPAEGGQAVLVSNTAFADFRCLLAVTAVDHESVALTPALAERLGVAEGDTVRVVTVNPAEKIA